MTSQSRDLERLKAHLRHILGQIPTRHERLVDEMAVVLCDVPELGNDVDCVQALLAAGYRPKDIAAHLDEARELARAARAGEGDLWATLWQERSA